MSSSLPGWHLTSQRESKPSGAALHLFCLLHLVKCFSESCLCTPGPLLAPGEWDTGLEEAGTQGESKGSSALRERAGRDGYAPVPFSNSRLHPCHPNSQNQNLTDHGNTVSCLTVWHSIKISSLLMFGSKYPWIQFTFTVRIMARQQVEVRCLDLPTFLSQMCSPLILRLYFLISNTSFKVKHFLLRTTFADFHNFWNVLFDLTVFAHFP